MTSVLDKQAQAVIREYREALQDHNVDLALRIYNANLDMWKALAQTEDEMLEEVGCSADDMPAEIEEYLAERTREREGYVEGGDQQEAILL